MGDERTGLLMKYVMVIAIVAMFAWFMTQADPTGPQLAGWSTLQTTMSNPLGTLAVAWDFHQNPNCGWDPMCALGNMGNAIIGFFTGIGSLITWLIGLLVNVGGGLFGVMTLTFSPPIPFPFQVILWAFTAGFWILVLMTVLGALRGN